MIMQPDFIIYKGRKIMKVLFGVEVGEQISNWGLLTGKVRKLLKKWAIKTDLSNEENRSFLM